MQPVVSRAVVTPKMTKVCGKERLCDCRKQTLFHDTRSYLSMSGKKLEEGSVSVGV